MRGATKGGHYYFKINLFQSTRPRGARPSDTPSSAFGAMFQSTRPRGARRSDHSGLHDQPRFNPRAHAGRDLTDYSIGYRVDVSIHAPTRGATGPSAWTTSRTPKFQSTRPRGARLTGDANTSRLMSFNPRAHAGRDIVSWRFISFCSCFNPRAHAGRDLYAGSLCTAQSDVSIHAPTRGATK